MDFILCPAILAVLSFASAPASGVTPAARSFHWGDYDGDGLADLYVRAPGTADRLLHNAGDGRFEDVTHTALPFAAGTSRVVLWQDVDADDRLDLILASEAGELQILHNHGGHFVDASPVAGVVQHSPVLGIHMLDFDADELVDLELETEAGPQLWHNRGNVSFEEVNLDDSPVPDPEQARGAPDGLTGPAAKDDVLEGIPPSESAAQDEAAPHAGGGAFGIRTGTAPPVAIPWRGPGGGSNRGPSGGTPGVISRAPASAVTGTLTCAQSIEDQAGSGCIVASTAPALGQLYPLGPEFNIDGSGNVGIGTTTPGAKLDVVGSGQFHDTLKLAPSSDEALDVSSGSIYKNGLLFIHTKGSSVLFRNTAIGELALASPTSSSSGNTATGYRALYASTYGVDNTATGARALVANTIGSDNTAVGIGALQTNTIGSGNTAIGEVALPSNTTGNYNMAIGSRALLTNTSGSYNIGIGSFAGAFLSTGDNNIAIANPGYSGESNTTRIGYYQTRAHVAGIRGVTTGNADAIPVVIDSAGQLGTISSSQRFKEDVEDMGDASERLLDLRPVIFRYKREVQSGERPIEYGLIAEEVAEVFPELAVYDEEGKPLTVKYHLLSSMLLNELKKQSHELEQHASELDALRARLATLEGRDLAQALPSDTR